MRWTIFAIGTATSLAACTPDDARCRSAGCADPSSVDTLGPATSDATSSEDTSVAETGMPVECPAGGGASITLAVDPPDPNAGGESSDEHRDAECDVSGVGGDAVSGWTLSLACDDGIATTITITTADSPFAWVDDAQPIVLDLDRWSGFEIGGGTSLSLAQAGAVTLLAFDETAEGGVIGHCAAEDDTFRAAANERLASIDARVEPAGCDDAATFRLTREADGAARHVYPGEIGDLGDGLVAVLEESRCTVQENSNAEGWHLELLIRRG